MIFSHPDFSAHESISWHQDPATGLRGLIAIHSTRLGPACGGCRLRAYASEEEALRDVLRLSRGMTLKCAAAGLPLGGGKMVVVLDPGAKTPTLLRAIGRMVEAHGGRYITGEDMGMTRGDLDHIREETRWVDPPVDPARPEASLVTARGVLAGMQAAVARRHGASSLRDSRVAIQGLGKVGWALAGLLHAEGADLAVTDLDPARVAAARKAFHATPAHPDSIYSAAVDIFAPCAGGGILNPDSIPRLRAAIVAGSANNQLEDESRDSAALAARGILLAPDFILNAGGVIQLAAEWFGWEQEEADSRVAGIASRLEDLWAGAREASGHTPQEEAIALAEGRLG